MYETAVKLMAKQKVALEVLSYHASAGVEESERLEVGRTALREFCIFADSVSNSRVTNNGTSSQYGNKWRIWQLMKSDGIM